MAPDGGHDVAEVQGSDGAAFVLVFCGERLARVLQLQLLQQQREDGGVVRHLRQRVRSCDKGHPVASQR